MIGGKELRNGGVDSADESSRSKLTRPNFEPSREYPDKKGVEFLRDSEMGGVHSKPTSSSMVGGASSGLQELTLSYLCDAQGLGLAADKDIPIPGKSLLLNNHSLEKVVSHKGKEILVSENSNHLDGGKFVERDFLSLSDTRENNSSKRSVEEEEEEQESNREKKPRLETLNLSLALPDVSLSLTASNALQNGADQQQPQPLRPKPTRPSTTTWSNNDCTATASLSYSYSHPFSHNPSCSLTRNSTDNFDYSVSKDDQIWNCGEGTNGSVHSRFKPIGDGVGFSNHGGGISSFMQGNSQFKTTSSDNHSFFPSELPARPRFEAQSGDSRGRNSENVRFLEGLDGGGKMKKLSRPERILREVVSESVPAAALMIQELADEVIASTKEYLKNLIEKPDKKDELVSLQSRLERRSDLSKETLSKCHKVQLEILVSVKMGLANFLSGKIQLSEMVEVFLYRRCRNVNCKSLLPVDDCDCKICSGNKGFCSSCMCPICLNFDCASNTCSWVGCDVCSHWCHAVCGIQRNLIKPGPSLKGPAGTSEMQFHCIGCGHASEMFGFVKDVFMCCAKDWGLETLMKELDCVRKIFRGSEDRKGKELHVKTDDMLLKLQTKMASPSDACNYITQFFNYADNLPDFPLSAISAKDIASSQSNITKDTPSLPKTSSLMPKYAYDMSYSRPHSGALPNDLHQKDFKASILSELKTEADFQLGALLRKGGLDSLESIVRIKEAEAKMFQTKADEARREAEGFQKMIRTKTAQMEEEYAEKLAKLCLHETEEMRRKKLEELKVLEGSHYDYYKMKKRMQDEIDGLLERMEATKQQWV
ncbi:protein OBERON 3 [Arachis duranensis]|uniref:Protein OBERON 3 n=1 Tax=Arachis duranensis TaxID=130453 RepID=A0A6P4CVC5_ARADU|nr:protein OBERON 3 [Arachis duranensis]XP_057749329.1 protein OBERON 3 [Arachis stenosperma]